MAHTIQIAAAADMLNQYVSRFSPQIHSTLRQGLEFERDVPFVQAESAYSGVDATVSGGLQPWQPTFTPNNTEDWDGVDSYLRPVKVDLRYDAEQLEKLFSKWGAQWFDTDPEDIRNGYAAYVIENVMVPKIMEDLNRASWAGEYVAPAEGVAGTFLQSIDGYQKMITDHINNGNLTPLTMGVFAQSTAVEQIRDACASLDDPYRYARGRIYMSKTNAQKYHDNYLATYPTRRAAEEEADQMYLRVDNYNKRIVGATAMEGSDRMVWQFDNLPGMIVGTRTGKPRYFNFRFEPKDYTLKCFAVIYRFYNFDTLLHTFVNDQA